jgi:hypothetical protein
MLVVLALGLATSYASSECQHTTCVWEHSKVNPTDDSKVHRIRVIHKNSLKEGWTAHHGPSSKPPTCNTIGGFCDDAEHYTHECKYDVDADECTCTCASETTTSTSGQTTVPTCNNDQWRDGSTCTDCPVAAPGVQGYKCNGTTKTPYGWDGVERETTSWSTAQNNKACRQVYLGPNYGKNLGEARAKCVANANCRGLSDENTNANKEQWYACKNLGNSDFTKNNKKLTKLTRKTVQCKKNNHCLGASTCRANGKCTTA